MKKTLNILTMVVSYLFVAVIAAAITLYAVLPRIAGIPQGATKLDTLQQLILDRFIGDVDEVELGDAAAQAMIDPADPRSVDGDRAKRIPLTHALLCSQCGTQGKMLNTGDGVICRDGDRNARVFEHTSGFKVGQADLLLGS